MDNRKGGGINNPTLVINDTVINNYISGEEAWFKAYGMSAIALQLKSGINEGIVSTGRTIIKDVTNPITGLETEMINSFVTEPHNGAKETDGQSNVSGHRK